MPQSSTQTQRFNIDAFRSKLHDKGVHHAAHFSMIIHNTPKGMNDTTNSEQLKLTSNELLFRIDATTIPGVLLATGDISRYGIGPVELKPYAPVFDRVNISAIDDRNGEVYNFFQTWMKLIVNYDLRNRSPNNANGVLEYQEGFEIAYKEDYMVDITIVAYNPEGNETIKTHLREAFPVFLGSIDLNWASPNQIVKVPLSFTFHDWYQEKEVTSNVTGRTLTPDLTRAVSTTQTQ